MDEALYHSVVLTGACEAGVEAVCGVEVLIHDAQYGQDELRQGKQGWGHSAGLRRCASLCGLAW
jgi:hypothetical protein